MWKTGWKAFSFAITAFITPFMFVCRPAILLVDTIKDQLDSIVRDFKFRDVTLMVHPYVAAYLQKGVWSLERRWRWEYRCKFKVTALHELGFLDFRFIDKHGDEIDVNLLSEMQ